MPSVPLTGENKKTEKELLLENVKRQAKQLMEEAVTRKFIHADSSCVTALCASVETCISHKLKKRAGGLLGPETTDTLLSKLTKYCPSAAAISKQYNDILETTSTRSVSPIPSLMSESPMKPSKGKNGYHASGSGSKYLWIRIALLEKVLALLISALVEHWRDFYESDAFIADEVLGASLVWLLDGPCSLDYSKMKTPDNLWTDPSADELVLRHSIYSSSGSKSSQVHLSKPQLFTSSKARGDAISGVPQVAREHVDSLHQNSHSSLLFGKNNVVLHAAEFLSPVAGYLSLHKCPESLLLKWTPNPMMDNKGEADKSLFWDRVLTVDMADVVFLHCHQTGDQGGSIVLIGQDGLQLPPMNFPSGTFCHFLSCLEQGLHPNGRLDPPLYTHTNGPAAFGKLKKRSREKITEEVESLNIDDSRDYVFRLVAESSTSNLDKRELQRLLSRTSPKKFKPVWKGSEERKRTLLPRMHQGRLQRNAGIPARVSLELACEKMKHQIIARAFYGWFGHCKYLKTVRTHLASLVLPLRFHNDAPKDAEFGLTEEKWKDLQKFGKVEDVKLLMQYVYEGGVEPTLRKQVWPYLLGHSLFGTTPEDRKQMDNTCKDNYLATLQECKTIELYLRDKEKDILALSGFAEGDTINSQDLEDNTDAVSCNTLDVDEVESVTKSLSDTVGSDTIGSSQELDSKGVDKNANRNQWQDLSLISSMIQTKENLREMVENASQKGREAWRNLVRKNSSRPRSKSNIEDRSVALKMGDHDKLISFDIELSCQSCGKKIIESRESILGGSLGDTNMESVHCIGCSQNRNKWLGDEDDDHYHHVTMDDMDGMIGRRIVDAKGDVFIPLRRGSQNHDVITVNGEDVARNSSVSTVGSQYAEDVLKDFALNIHRIDKDVLRCDRNHPYFYSHNLEKLRNVMMSYVWDRLEVGYVQGMCDLCAPLLVVFDDEAKAYSCFVNLMERMGGNFPHGDAMDSHLSNIKSLIQILDPELDETLNAQGDNSIFFFCYRWFLLDFKREMAYDNVYMVWETIWAAQHITSANFNLFVALALIELYRDIIIDNEMEVTDIIKFFNEMAEKHDAKATLNLARSIVRKLQEVMHPSDFNDTAVE